MYFNHEQDIFHKNDILIDAILRRYGGNKHTLTTKNIESFKESLEIIK